MAGSGAHGSAVDILAIDHGDELFVVPAGQVLSISPPLTFAEARSAAVGGAAVDLDHLLLGTPLASGTRPGRTISVRAGGGVTPLFTGADLELREAGRPAFFDLPRVLGAGGCDPWVKGVLVEEASQAAGRLALWIDLSVLADGWLATRGAADAMEA